MIEIKPKAFDGFQCPVCCSTSSEILHTIFIGANTIANCKCSSCNIKFFHTYPTGHALYFPVVFLQDGSMAKYSKKSESWFARPLIEAMINGPRREGTVSKTINKMCSTVVILNCLDYCYAHVISKLLNAQYYLSKWSQIGLILIIPRSFLWMIPNGVAEIWSLDIDLNELKENIKGFNSFIHNELERFDQVYLSIASLHHDFSEVDFKLFLRSEPFNWDSFCKNDPQITFFWREDRTWTKSVISELIYKASVWIKVQWIKRQLSIYLMYRQKRLITKTAIAIKKKFKSSKFCIVGLGTTGKFCDMIEDFRTDNINEDIQKKWCSIYSFTHVVIGVHGSNMMIPSFLAAGYLELLPRYKISNYMENIAPKQYTFYAQYLGRILDVRSTPALVAQHVYEMINGFQQLYYESFIKHEKHKNMDSFYKYSKLINKDKS